MRPDETRVEAPTDLEIFGGGGVSALVRPTTRAPLQELLQAAGVHALGKDSTAEDVRDALEHLRAEVVAARLDDLDLATLNKLVLDTLAEAKIRHVRGLVNAALVSPSTAPAIATDSPLALVRDDEPHPQPVGTAEVLNTTAALVRRYVVLSREAADTVALWVAAAWVIEAASISAILAILAPVLRCGKSKLAEVVGACAPRAIMLSSLTPAVLFRLIDEYHPTLVADEADTWLTDEKSELRGIFNAGHSQVPPSSRGASVTITMCACSPPSRHACSR